MTDVVELNPSQPSVVPPDKEEVTFLGMAAVEALSGHINTSEVRAWSDVKKGYKRFQEGDVLFAKITPCMENGKVAVAKGLLGLAGAGSTEFHVLRPMGVLLPQLLMYYLVQEDFRKAARSRMTGTAGQLRVPELFLEEQQLPIAPLPEQHRIVDAIESYLSRLDDAVATLERVQRNLKRYRASVLKAAVEGRLVPTEATLARKEGRTYESASVLLERILEERRRRWKENGGKGKYKEPAAPNTSGLPELPDGWCWARAEQVSEFITKGTTPKSHLMHPSSGDIPYIKVYNLTFGGSLDFSVNPTFVGTNTHTGLLSRSVCYPGDVLANIVGPPLGKVSIVPDTHPEWNINQAIARFRPQDGLIQKYLAIVLMSPLFLDWAKHRSKATAGQFNLTLEICRDAPIPLPPVAEQVGIVEEFDRVMSLAEGVSSALNSNLARCQRARQAILKWAFEGKLVDQDPTDEPAAILLERIKAERAALTTGRRRRTR